MWFFTASYRRLYCLRNRFVSGLLLAALLLLPIPASGQDPSVEVKELKKEIESLKIIQTEILKELLEIKKLLAARSTASSDTPPREIIIDTEGAPSKGNETARYTLIEFSDYQCPFCSRYVRDTLPLIERDYIKTGKIKYVFRDFPIESLHPNALLASEAAACAREQGKYWEMHDRLFSSPSALNAKDMTTHAQSIGINPASFQQCLDSSKYREPIRKAIDEAAGIGVNGTPTFFVAQSLPNSSKVKVIRALRGAPAYANFKEVLDALLASGQ
jgi:protein-disulfide isomerase